MFELCIVDVTQQIDSGLWLLPTVKVVLFADSEGWSWFGWYVGVMCSFTFKSKDLLWFAMNKYVWWRVNVIIIKP